MNATKETIKTCYSCKERNPISKMTLNENFYFLLYIFGYVINV